MELIIDKDKIYKDIKNKLNNIEVKFPLNISNITVGELMKHYYNSEHHSMYNAFKFHHMEHNYNIFNSIDDYCEKIKLKVIIK